jgi:hypothetical protein
VPLAATQSVHVIISEQTVCIVSLKRRHPRAFTESEAVVKSQERTDARGPEKAQDNLCANTRFRLRWR